MVDSGFDNDEGVSTTCMFDRQVQMQALPLAPPSQKCRKGEIAFSLDTNEDDTPGWNRGAAHGHSTNLRDTAEYTEAVLGVQSGVPT